MPRPTYDFILNQLRECQKENGALSTDEEWNVITRKALPFRLSRVAESARWVVLIRIHTSTLKGGEESLNGSIRRALNTRDAAVLERARWSENEALFILSAAPENFCEKITPVFKNEGISVSMAYVPYSGNVGYDHDRAQEALSVHIYVKE